MADEDFPPAAGGPLTSPTLFAGFESVDRFPSPWADERQARETEAAELREISARIRAGWREFNERQKRAIAPEEEMEQ